MPSAQLLLLALFAYFFLCFFAVEAQYWRFHEVVPHTNSHDWGQRGPNNAYPGHQISNNGITGVWALCSSRNCGVGRK